MRIWLVGLIMLLCTPAFSQQQPPVVVFDSVPDTLKLPDNLYFGEVSGIAVNSNGHVFVLSRGNTTGPAYAAAACAASAWSRTAHAQQSMPVIGLLNGRARGNLPKLLAAFRQGLNDTGYIEGQNVAIEYSFAENQYERLPALRHQVTVIAATGAPAALAAKAATTTVPVVFETGG